MRRCVIRELRIGVESASPRLIIEVPSHLLADFRDVLGDPLLEVGDDCLGDFRNLDLVHALIAEAEPSCESSDQYDNGRRHGPVLATGVFRGTHVYPFCHVDDEASIVCLGQPQAEASVAKSPADRLGVFANLLSYL